MSRLDNKGLCLILLHLVVHVLLLSLGGLLFSEGKQEEEWMGKGQGEGQGGETEDEQDDYNI